MTKCKICGLEFPTGTWRDGEFYCDTHERAIVNLVLDVAADITLRKIPIEASLAKRQERMKELKMDEDYLVRMVFSRIYRGAMI